MNIQARVTEERDSKGQNASEKLNIELLDEGGDLLALLVFKRHPKEAGRYLLGEDFFFRSARLTIQTCRELADSPLVEILPPSCRWCRRGATVRRRRTIDGTRTSTPECGLCILVKTAALLERATEEAKLKTASIN